MMGSDSLRVSGISKVTVPPMRFAVVQAVPRFGDGEDALRLKRAKQKSWLAFTLASLLALMAAGMATYSSAHRVGDDQVGVVTTKSDGSVKRAGLTSGRQWLVPGMEDLVTYDKRPQHIEDQFIIDMRHLKIEDGGFRQPGEPKMLLRDLCNNIKLTFQIDPDRVGDVHTALASAKPTSLHGIYSEIASPEADQFAGSFKPSLADQLPHPNSQAIYQKLIFPRLADRIGKAQAIHMGGIVEQRQLEGPVRSLTQRDLGRLSGGMFDQLGSPDQPGSLAHELKRDLGITLTIEDTGLGGWGSRGEGDSK